MRPLVWPLGFFLIALTAVSAQAETITLSEAQAQLFKNNLDILTAEVELRKANDDLSDAQCAYFPSLDASASYDYQTRKNALFVNMSKLNPMLPDSTTEMTLGANDRAEFGLDLSYPFFTGFSRYYGVTSRKEAVSAKRASLDAAKNRASLGLGLLYFQWELSYRQAGLRKTLVEQLDTYAKQITAQREAGTALRSQLLDAQARLQLARVDLEAAYDQTDSLRREFMSFILSRDRSMVPDTAGTTALDTLPMPKSPKTDGPEIVALDHASLQIEELRKVLQYRHFPSLFGTAGLRYGRPGLYLGKNSYMGYGQVGVQLKWNLFDGFKTQAEGALLQRQLDLIDIARTRQNETVERTFEDAKRQVNSAAERLSACEAASEAARALTDDLKNAVSAGTATAVDYLNAIVNQAQTELLVAQSKTAKKMALLKLWFAAGKTIKY